MHLENKVGIKLNPVTLVMIVRNEERSIKRCLLSAKKFVGRMVVLDTGSTDSTVEIARSCGAEVYFSKWECDFSLARNTALDMADADWNLILDADEWIEDGGADLLKITTKSSFLGVLQIQSEFAESRINISYIARLLPRGVRYRGRIHEQPISALPRIRIPLMLGHDGYSNEQIKIKHGRNRPLLLKELELNPNEPYTLYQLGKDFQAYDEPSIAAKYFLQATEYAGANAPYRRSLYVRLLDCLRKSDRLEDAIILAGVMMDEWTGSPDYFFTVGNLFLDFAVLHPDEAIEQWLPMAEAAWIRCLDIGECPMIDESVIGYGSFLAAHKLAVIYGGLGNFAKESQHLDLAERLRKEHDRPFIRPDSARK